MFLFGIPTAIIPIIVTKSVGTWFQGHRLALAQGILTMSMALGFTLGTLLSATAFSPLLGSWRNVMFIYGAISIAISIPWFLTRSVPSDVELSAADVRTLPFRQAILHVFRIRGVWLLAIVLLGHIACVQRNRDKSVGRDEGRNSYQQEVYPSSYLLINDSYRLSKNLLCRRLITGHRLSPAP